MYYVLCLIDLSELRLLNSNSGKLWFHLQSYGIKSDQATYSVMYWSSKT